MESKSIKYSMYLNTTVETQVELCIPEAPRKPTPGKRIKYAAKKRNQRR